MGKVGRLLKKGGYAERIGAGAPVYLAAVLECRGTGAREGSSRVTASCSRSFCVQRGVVSLTHCDIWIERDLALPGLAAGKLESLEKHSRGAVVGCVVVGPVSSGGGGSCCWWCEGGQRGGGIWWLRLSSSQGTLPVTTSGPQSAAA